MIKNTNPLKRSAWAVFLYRGRQVRLYLLRNSNLVDKERMVELLARRYMTEPESIVVDDDFESILSVAEQAEKMARNEYPHLTKFETLYIKELIER